MRVLGMVLAIFAAIMMSGYVISFFVKARRTKPTAGQCVIMMLRAGLAFVTLTAISLIGIEVKGWQDWPDAVVMLQMILVVPVSLILGLRWLGKKYPGIMSFVQD